MSRRKKRDGRSRSDLKSEWRSWYLEKAPILGFAAKFALLILLLYIVLDLPVGDRLLYAYLKASAWLADLILRGFGQHTQISDDVVIKSARFSMALRRGCDAVEPTWLVCAAILAFPAPIIKKLRGILVATVLLQALNLVRILSLYWIGIHLPAFFNTAHLELWPTAFILAAIVIFIGWRGGMFDCPARRSA